MPEKIKLDSEKRPFTIIYWDFIESNRLTWKEKDIFIILKKFANSNNQCFPSINTLCRLSQLSKMTVLKALNGLKEKKVISIEHRKNSNNKGHQSNLYTIYDYPELWKAEEDKETDVDLEEIWLFQMAQKKGYRLEKELGTTEPVEETVEPSILNKKNNQYFNTDNNVKIEKSQDSERYTLGQIQQIFGYENIVANHPDQQQDIEAVMSVLYKAINTNKPTIRISGQDKPSMVVIGKLMKLNEILILYAVEKYKEQTSLIKNPMAYLLTILYHAPEQYYLDIKNKEKSKEKSKEDDTYREQKKQNINTEQNNDINKFANFKQRTYDFEELERELLQR